MARSWYPSSYHQTFFTMNGRHNTMCPPSVSLVCTLGNFNPLAAKYYILTKTLPIEITLKAHFNRPSKDCISSKVVFSLTSIFLILNSFSSGKLKFLLTASIFIPKNSNKQHGKTVLSQANSILNYLAISSNKNQHP